MEDCITISHGLPSFSVTEEPEFLPCTDGGLVVRTRGRLEGEVEACCPTCGGRMSLRSYETVLLRDVPVFTAKHFLEVRQGRHRCGRCGTEARQEMPFKAEGHFITGRLADLVRRYQGLGMTNKAVHRLLGVDVHLAKDLEKASLEKLYGAPPAEPSRYIAVDEICIHRHRRYATVVIDLETGHVLFCEAGKKKEQVEHFLEFVGKEWMGHVRAVSMDMNAQYDSAFREGAPHVRIVYDPFHLVKLYGESVITRLRRRLQNEARDRGDKHAYDTLKGGRYILLGNRSTLERRDALARENNRDLAQRYEVKGLSLPPGRRKMNVRSVAKLDELMAVNKDLNAAYVLLEQFKLAYKVHDPALLESGMTRWCDVARQCGIPELLAFSSTVQSHMQGIVNHAVHSISSGRLEGTNNLAKVIKRTAYGFSDDRYFFLKLMDASRRPYYKPKSHKFLH